MVRDKRQHNTNCNNKDDDDDDDGSNSSSSSSSNVLPLLNLRPAVFILMK